MTTKERIEADIKKNVTPRIAEVVRYFMEEEVTPRILMEAGTLVRHLTNLSSVGSKAGDSEVASAHQKIEQQIAKALTVELKKVYHFK